jgi:hypothetical protein
LDEDDKLIVRSMAQTSFEIANVFVEYCDDHGL